MSRFIQLFLGVGVITFGFGVVHASDLMSAKKATPTIEERITERAVKGTLTKREGQYYWIKDNNGKERMIQIDDGTKLDKVAVGDPVTAYVTGKGLATTLQRVN